jgi:hypothetical protein
MNAVFEIPNYAQLQSGEAGLYVKNKDQFPRFELHLKERMQYLSIQNDYCQLKVYGVSSYI